jgi:hypothetical protein
MRMGGEIVDGRYPSALGATHSRAGRLRLPTAVQHDERVESEPSGADQPRQDVILVTRPVTTSPPRPLDALFEVVSNSVGMAVSTATTLAAMVEQTVAVTVETSVNAALDRVVPAMVDAIIARLDLTQVVLTQVDLNRVVNAALDSLDLTQLVIDRVDVNRIVDQADIDAIIDRVPIIPLANYVIEEIDLPQIIRESTGGVATDAVNSIRVQSVGADQLVSRMADRFLLRRRQRNLDVPGDPESLVGRMAEDLSGSGPTEPVADGLDDSGEVR